MQGTTGIAAELGHVVLNPDGPICGCGQLGCLEAYCGGRNVALRIQDVLRHRSDHALLRLPEVDGDLEKLNFQAVREGAKLGIPLAVKMWDEICMRLAQGIGIYMVTFNPEMIVLGTSAYYSGDVLLKPVMDYLPRFAWQEFREACAIRITELGPKIGELAGISVALYGLYEDGVWTPPGA
jgi:glucokinase